MGLIHNITTESALSAIFWPLLKTTDWKALLCSNSYFILNFCELYFSKVVFRFRSGSFFLIKGMGRGKGNKKGRKSRRGFLLRFLFLLLLLFLFFRFEVPSSYGFSYCSDPFQSTCRHFAARQSGQKWVWKLWMRYFLLHDPFLTEVMVKNSYKLM